MPLVLADRVKDTTTTTGTGTVTLSGSPPTGFQSFAVVGDGNTTFYTITAGSEWEVGIGTYTASGTTLARTTVTSSSNAGSLVNFSAGVKDVFVTYPAERSVYTTATAELAIPAPGTVGNVLTSDGTSWVSQAGATAANVQTFLASGTWTKPAGSSFVLVETWGAGGGGGRPRAGATSSNSAGAGGGGGTYNYRTFLASELTSTVTVTVGAGGTGGSANATSGGVGGNTTFGTLLTSFGGGGGNSTDAAGSWNNGGSGAGVLGVGSVGSTGVGGAVLGGEPRLNNDGTTTGVVIRAGQFGGGAAGGSITGLSAANANGAPSAFGGGGGGGCITGATNTSGLGGSSSNGGGGGGAGGGLYGTANLLARAGGGNTGTSGGGGAAGTSSSFAGVVGGFRQGGGGGFGIYLNGFETASVANNGAQVVALGNAYSSGTGFSGTYLFVSSNGLSTYTPYLVSLSIAASTGTSNIVYDGTKYVIFLTSSILSTTDFVNFTTHTNPPGSTNYCSRPYRYLNGFYFACRTTDLYYSTDLATWTRCNVLGGSDVSIVGVAFDGTRYYALRDAASNANVYVSTTLTSGWTANNSGASNPRGIDAKAGEVVVSSSLTPFARYSTNNGTTWINSPTTLTSSWNVQYVNNFLTITGNSTAELYYTSSAASGFTTAADPATAYWYNDGVYNGTRYVFAGEQSSGGSGTLDVVIASTAVGGTYAWQTTSAFSPTGGAGGTGGIAGGGGGGGGIGFTTTGNGGTGGAGYCRVYTW